MSVVSLKGISGITSITNAAGASDVLTFHSNNTTERARITSGGNFGIGTNNPQRLLHLQSTSDALLRVTAADGNIAYIELGDVSDPDGGKIAHDASSNTRFYTQSLERLCITSAGNVGIGTDSLSSKLHVRTAGVNQTMFMLEADMGTNNNRTLYVKSPTSDSISEPFTFHTGNSFQFKTDANLALRIHSDGNVGIGTDNPSRVLHVQDNTNTLLALDSTDTNADLVQSDTGGSTRIRSVSGALEFYAGGDASSTNATSSVKNLSITSAGVVQVIKPGSGGNSKLEITQSGGGGGTSEILFSDSVSGRGRIYYDHGSNPEGVKIESAGTQTVIVTTAGKVGIGTENPASPLHIGQSTDNDVTAGITLKNNPSIGAQRFTLYNEEDVGTHYNSNDGGTARAHIFETGGSERLRIASDGHATFANGISFGPHSGHTNDENMKMHMYSDDNINDAVNFTVAIQFGNANNGPFMIELYQAHSHYTGTASYCKILGSYGASDASGGGCSFLVLEKQGHIDTGGVFAVTDNSTTTQRTNNTDYTITIAGKSASSNTGTSLKNKTYVIVYSRTNPASVVFA